MRLEVTLTTPDGSQHHLVIDGSPSATLRQALEPLVGAATPVKLGANLVNLDDPLGSSPVVNGSNLGVGRPGPATPWPLAGPTLGVAGGAASGQFLAVPSGPLLIGRQAPAHLVISDSTVSARHATCSLAADGSLVLVDQGSTNGTFVGGERLLPGKAATVPPGGRFLVGDAVVTLLPPARPDGSVDVGVSGERLFNRVIRYRTPDTGAEVALPPPPPAAGRSSMVGQLVGSGAMLVGGVGAAVVYGNPLFAVLGLLAPVAMIGAAILQGRGARKEASQRTESYAAKRAGAEQQIAAAAATESERHWQASSDPTTCALAALGPTSQLWSVDGFDQAAGTIRVGHRDRPANVTIQGSADGAASAPMLIAVPQTVDLRATAVLGIAGPLAHARGAARAMVHQLAATRSPDDLLIFHLSADPTNDGWSWLRWLPHVRGLDEYVHTVSPSPDALKARLTELIQLIEQRTVLRGYGYGEQLILPEILVVLDGAGALRGRGNVVRVLKEGPAVGIRVIAVDESPSRLPAEATARLVFDPSRTGAQVSSLEAQGTPTIGNVALDEISEAVAEATARALAPLRPLGGGAEGGLPAGVRFADLIGLETATTAQVLAGWRGDNEGQAVVGVDEHGAAAVLDITHDGPHALVAGTSGSGKSEFLRTLLAGLALSASPQELALFLIDFKGGGAFGKLSELPHVVGYADDLTIGGPLADRLLASLKAELDLRKQRFKDAGNVEGLSEYRAARRLRPDLPALARLVLVIDEFAELKEAQPDFVEGMVKVARTGRSLGVHLILATQQPAGVVTPQIRDNANLRVCLRVLDPGTSQDLVGSPVAATFSNRQKGRAVVLSGDSPPTTIQGAYISAPVRKREEAAPPPTVVPAPWQACGIRPGKEARAEGSSDSRTDLSEFVDLIRRSAREAAAPTSRRPWLAPLQPLLLLGDMTAGAQVPFGLALFAVEDKPAEQRQSSVSLALGGGNIGIVGGSRSGRSTALRTVAVSLASRHSADDVHLYVIDAMPTPVLRPLAELPHCGVLATRSQRHKIERLVHRLLDLADQRSALISKHSLSSHRELRAAFPDAPPNVVVLIDGWDQFAAEFQGASEHVRTGLIRLAEHGPTLGIQLVVAGGKAIIGTKLIGALEQVLCLRFDQRQDLADFGVPIRDLPDEIPPGRAFRPGTGRAVQIALLDRDPATEAQNRAVEALVQACPRPERHQPFRLDELPARITLEAALKLPGANGQKPLSFVAAVGGDELSCRTVELDRRNGPFVIAGPPGSGRTEALAAIARQLSSRGIPVAVVPGKEEDRGRFAGATVLDLCPSGPAPEGAVILVDDAGRFADDDPFLCECLADSSRNVVLAGEPARLGGYAGWRVGAKTSRSGLLLSAKYGDGELIGCTVGMPEAFSAGAGRAYLGMRGRIELVQVPMAG